jgi:hypothetical protein
MADLPRYQPTGRVFADVPQLDFANVRESFKKSQSMSSGLDRLSEFAGKYAAKRAEAEAEQFAVDNPITIDDLKQAQQSGIKPEDLVKATGGGTIWQDTLRKFQGEQLRSQLEVFGQAALADIQTQVQLGQLTDINEIKDKFNSAVIGYEKPLANINPESAVRFKQSMAATANSFYKEATKKLEEDYRNDQQVLSVANFDNSIKAAKSMIATITDPAMLEETKGLLFKRVYEQAREGGTAFAQKQAENFLKEFDALKFNHIVSVVTDPKFAPDMITAVIKIKAGDLGDATPLYNGMSKEEQSKARTNAIAGWNDLYTATKKEDDYRKLQSKEQDKADVIKLYSTSTPAKEKRTLAIDLFKRDAISESTLNEVLNPKPKETDENNLSEARAESDIISGHITSEKQLRSIYPGLSTKSVAKLLPKIASTTVQDATKIIRTAAGASENPYAILDDNTSGRIQAIKKIQSDIKNKQNTDGSFPDDVSAANEAVKQYQEGREYATAKTAQKSVVTRIQKVYPDYNPDTMSADAYAKKAGLNDAEKAKLKTLHNSYKQQKTITGLGSDQL